MQEYLPFLVIGLASGSIYAIAAMGLVVTYKTSGVFNFAHGAVGMIATFIFYSLRVDLGVPTWLAAALAILVVAPLIGVIIDRLLLRRLRGAAASSYVVVSLGLLVSLQYLAIVIYGPAVRSVEPIFSRGTFRLPGVNVGYDQSIIVAISLASALLLAAFFRATRLGIQTRAVVDDADLTELMGTSSARVTTFAWMLGCSFAALAGVLLSPFLGVDAVLLTLLVIKAFGAAAVGRLVSLPLTYAGAIGIGIGESLLTKWVAARPSLAGLPTSLSFIVLFAVLVFSRKGSFAELTTQAVRTAGGARARLAQARGRRFPLRLLLGLTAFAVVLPARLDGSRLLTATSTLAFVLVFASLGLLVGLSRQVSLCHAVFVVFGATTLSHFQEAGIPYLLALLLAGLVLVPVGALVAIPAIRLSGLFLALATFGFGVLAQYLIFGTKFAFGTKALRTLTRPELFGISFSGDKAFYYFVLAVVVTGVVAIELVRVTRLGRLLRALADSTTATESLGVNPTASRVIVFCLTAFLAAIAGGLLGSLTQVVNPTSFDFSQSLFWIAVLVTAGAATLGGAILSAVLLVAVPAVFTAKAVTEWQPVAFGVMAIALAQAPNGLAGLFRLPDFTSLAKASAWRGHTTGSRLGERVAARAGSELMPPLLEVTGLRAGYGRTEVLHGVDLRVPPGSAVALLGSNGAGKTTLLKTIAGLVPARDGHVTFQGQRVERRPPNARARAGVCLIPEGRGIFRRLTVRENLTMQVGRRHLNGSLEKATARFPKLGQRMDQMAGTLSGGEQQMLALARALVTDPAVVLADELSVGLAPVIVDEIFEALDVLRAEGRSLLLVEQYVERAVGIADYVYILQKGEIVFVGEPSQCASGVVFAVVSRRQRLTQAHAVRPPSHEGLKVAAAIGGALLVAAGLVGLLAANNDGDSGSTPAPSSTTTVTASDEAKAFQTKVDDAFKPLGDAIKIFLPRAQEYEAGKVTPADFKANIDLALPEFVKARDAVAKIEEYKPEPAVNRYFVDAGDLYVEVARIYNVAVDPGSEPLRAQLNLAARRVRTLGDRIYDRGRAVLDPAFYAPPSQDVELRPPTEVPDWAAEGMAAGPPLAETPGPPAETPPIREVTCSDETTPPCRAEESEKKWESRVKKAGFPPPADLVAALGEENAARLGELAAGYEGRVRTLRAGPDPKGGRERAAVVALGLLTDGEAARLGQAASMLPPGEARTRLLTVARRAVVVGDGLLDPDLGLRPSGLPAALLEETGP